MKVDIVSKDCTAIINVSISQKVNLWHLFQNTTFTGHKDKKPFFLFMHIKHICECHLRVPHTSRSNTLYPYHFLYSEILSFLHFVLSCPGMANVKAEPPWI